MCKKCRNFFRSARILDTSHIFFQILIQVKVYFDSGEMGQGACSGYLKQDLNTPQKKSGSDAGSDTNSDDNNNSSSNSLTTMDLQKIAALEEQLRQKEAEIQGLQVRFQNMNHCISDWKMPFSYLFCRKPSNRCQNSNLFKVTLVSVFPNAKRLAWC